MSIGLLLSVKGYWPPTVSLTGQLFPASSERVAIVPQL